MPPEALIQLSVFLALTALVALATWLHCRKATRSTESTRDYFLAGGGLNWVFIGGTITLTNISTDTFIGMSGSQTLNIVWWEISGAIGLVLLAKIFLPIYYRYKCTTVTELLERRYNNKHIRATVALVFLIGNIFIFLPAMLYTSGLVMKSMFGLGDTLLGLNTVFTVGIAVAIVGAIYAIFGGLRAVAISDTYCGILVLGLGGALVFFALNAIGWDFSGIPAERLRLFGESTDPIPWPTLLTGMVFCQLYYWSTNQTITQRALAAPDLREARKGIYLALFLRAPFIPAMVVIPGLVAYKLYGPIGDASYGRLVGDILPHWLSGAFAAAMFAAVISSYNSVLNSSAALYVCDLHQRYIRADGDIRRLSMTVSALIAIVSVFLIPLYMGAGSIMAVIQQSLGIFSMPVLSAFIVGLLFRNVDARAVIATIAFGAALYAALTFGWEKLHALHPASVPRPWHFLHIMGVTVPACVAFALALNRLLFRRRALFGWDQETPAAS
ncbi:SLC5 family protein [Nibricoccus aquaticus]|uniref:SLC5 family protein n=1 Tax=Nibricoccus aquaticus TaxID=2576891 RepID=A0A290Q7S2_9BACT|nr:SLC5 family protein [Nibricoccus aquaticus]ATC64307.1 SLC5 family protein [Nibricoccus aquaticus]